MIEPEPEPEPENVTTRTLKFEMEKIEYWNVSDNKCPVNYLHTYFDIICNIKISNKKLQRISEWDETNDKEGENKLEALEGQCWLVRKIIWVSHGLDVKANSVATES